MASLALSLRFRRPLMAWTALLKTELLALSKSMVLRVWIIVLILTEFFGLTMMSTGQRAAAIPGSTFLTAFLAGYLMIWSNVIIILSASSISLNSEVLSDSILCRACTRTQVIIAKMAALWLVVLSIYLISAGIAGYCGLRYAANDMTVATMCSGIGIVGLAMLLLVSLGVAVSVIFNSPIFGVLAMLLIWYVATPIFAFIGTDYLSPTSLVRNLPAILKNPVAPQVVQCTATPSSLVVQFSRDVDPERAERLEYYAVESPLDQPQAPLTAVYDSSRSTVTLSGLILHSGQTAKVTVNGVADKGGAEISPAANSAQCVVADPAGVVPAPTTKPAAKAPKERSVDRVAPKVLRCMATQSSLKVFFSKTLSVKDAENPTNYLVENPMGNKLEPRAATYNDLDHSVLLSGIKLDPDTQVKVTVHDIKDMSGNTVATRDNSAIYSTVTLWKYVLGFGLPAILSCLLAIVWFTKRDL